MAIKEISVYRIDYEMRDKDEGETKLWSACIAAYDQQEAIDYLGVFLGKTFKIIQLGHECRLDALTNPIRQKVIDGYLLEEAHRTKGKEVKEETPKDPKEPKKRGKSITKK